MDELLELSRNCKYVTQYKQIFEMTCFFLSIKPPSKVYELCRVTLQHFLKIFLYEKLDRERNQETKKEYRKGNRKGKNIKILWCKYVWTDRKKLSAEIKLCLKMPRKKGENIDILSFSVLLDYFLSCFHSFLLFFILARNCLYRLICLL